MIYHKPSIVIEEKENTCHTDITPSIQVDETSHSLVQESKPETSPSSNESELIEAQDISSIKVPKENGSVDICLQTFLLLKVNLVQLCLIVKKVF